MKNSITSLLLISTILIISSSCSETTLGQHGSDIDLIEAVESVEYRKYKLAGDELRKFIAEGEIDMELYNSSVLTIDKPFLKTGEPTQELEEAVPGSKQRHQLHQLMSDALQNLNSKYGYLSLPESDRVLMVDLYRLSNGADYSEQELLQLLKKLKKSKV